MKTLNEKSDVKALAKEIIDKCKLIHPSKILEVEQLLFYLQNRKDAGTGKGTVHDAICCKKQVVFPQLVCVTFFKGACLGTRNGLFDCGKDLDPAILMSLPLLKILPEVYCIWVCTSVSAQVSE